MALFQNREEFAAAMASLGKVACAVCGCCTADADGRCHGSCDEDGHAFETTEQDDYEEPEW